VFLGLATELSPALYLSSPIGPLHPAVESDAIGSGSSEAETDPEVPERARVRTYSGAYKLRVLREYEELDKAGKGALLRR